MKKRLLATVCSAAILVNMVPYQAFADDVQATPETAQSIAMESAVQAFADDGQTQAYNYDLKVKVENSGSTYVKAGDTVKLAVTISNAQWATAANKAGLIAISLELKYNNQVFTPDYNEELGPCFKNLPNPNPKKSDTVSYIIGSNVHEDEGSVNLLIEAPQPAQISSKQWAAAYADLTANDTVIATYSFTANEDIPEGLTDDLTFVLTSKGKDNADSAFGDFVAQDSKVFVNASASIENGTGLKVDTKAPTITLSDTADGNKFTYSPVGVTVADDGIGLASVTFEGEDLGTSGSYELTKSGTLTAADKLGNTSTLTVTIDTTALDAARAAIGKLPDSGANYKNKADLEAAEKAVAALDKAAYSKLTAAELKKVEDARKTIDAIDADIDAAVKFIDEKMPQGDNIQPTADNIQAVSDAGDLLKALEKQGVDLEKDISNYSVYKNASDKLEAALDEINAVKNEITALDYKNYGDKAAVEALRSKVNALQKKYGDDILTDADLKNLTDAEAAIGKVADRIKAAVQAIDTLPTGTVKLADYAAIEAVQKEVEDLLNSENVPQAEITNYAAYSAVLSSKTKTEDAVKAVNAQVNALPEKVTLEKAVTEQVAAANTAAAEAQKAYGDDEHQVLSAAAQTKLNAAVKAVEDLNKKRSDLVDKIADAAVLDADAVKLTDAEAIGAIRKEVTDMQDNDKAEFTDAELARLVAAESALGDLQKVSKALHGDIENLPGRNEVKYSQKAAIAKLPDRMTEMEAKGDTFTAAEKQKVTDAAAGIQDIEDNTAKANTLIDSLPEDAENIEVTDENIKLVGNIDDLVKALDARGVDKSYFPNYDRYVSAKNALGLATEEIEATKKALANFTYVNYGKSADEARKLHTDVETYRKFLPADDLAKFDAAWKKLEDTEKEIGNVITAIGTLPTKDATLAEIEEIDAVTDRVNALLKDEEVPQEKITNYADYQKAVDAKAATKKAIADVKAQIEALPEKVTLEQSMIDQIYAAKKAANDLQETYGDANHQALDDATLNKLETANNDLGTLTMKHSNLVEDIDTMVNAEDVKLTDKADIENLRSRVKQMQDEDKATFDAAELNRLTAAEKALADLEQRSKATHDAVAALPAADTVKLSQKADIEALEQKIADMEAKGDSFTAAEKQKLTDAQKGIADLEKAQADMKTRMAGLKNAADVKYDDKAESVKLNDDIKALQNRNVTIDATTMGADAWNRYANYTNAVTAMNTELDGLKNKMQAELNSWTYPYDVAKYDALRKEMDAAAKKYGMTEKQAKAEFTNYETDKTQAAAAEDKIKQANDKIKALPATITKAQEQDVAAVTAILNELKAAPYKMTDAALKTALGNNYNLYNAAVATLAELNKPANNGNSNSSNNNNSNSSTTTGNSTTTKTSTANKTTKPAAAATTIPQTADAFPLTTLITLAVASLGGLVALLFKKKRND